MGNEKADAVRAALYDLLRSKYGDLKTAAVELGVPYKTLYRNLTPKGKDRNESVTLDFVIDTVEHVRAHSGGPDFPTFYADALGLER